MQVDVLGIDGRVSGKAELDDSVFCIEPNMYVLHDSIVFYMANQRRGTKSALTRSEVSGGGCKPWRQKGTGHARQGSIRAPQWTHGGIVFAPKPRDYTKTLNKKARQLAIRSAISLKLKEGNLIVLEDFSMDRFSTKYVCEILSNIDVCHANIILPEPNRFILNSSRNISNISVSFVKSLNSYGIFYHKELIIFKSAIEKINEIFGNVSNSEKVVA